MTSETAFSYEDVIAGSIVSVICAIGTGLMTLVIIGSSRIPSMKSSFGMLTINQNLAQLVACVACFIVFFFGVTLGIETVIDYGYIIGGITVVMLYVILVSFFIISFNRLCAIAFPIAYNFMFKEKFLFGILAVGWLTPFAYGMYLLVYRQCAYVFLHHGWYFDELKNEKCGAQLAIPVNLDSSDYAEKKNISISKRGDKTSRDEFREAGARPRRRFLMQGFWYQGGRNVMPNMSENWKIFWTTSFSANLLHVFDP
uniref:G_PROTEIN_RECEP_F1_2 domain-containing protein n=1 Tax=Caenorhabditis tropicalis TaxID=1561998 RepID=A0A1I7V3Z6_9PELO